MLIIDWPSIFPQPRKSCMSVKRTLSDIYNSIQLNKNQRSEATFLSRRKTGELTSRLPTLCSSTRTGAISPSTSSSWGIERHRVAVRTLVRLLRSHSGVFFLMGTWGGVYACGRLMTMGWAAIESSSFLDEGEPRRGTGKIWNGASAC